MNSRRIATAVVAIAALGVAAWYFLGTGDDRTIITARLNQLATEFNQSTRDGFGTVARAAQLASYLTDDIEIDLGQGSAPIRGRTTVIGMAERLQPRTAAFTLRFQDITVTLDPGETTATVNLTAEFVRSIATREESLDAREFSLGMKKADDVWRIATVTAVQVLK